MKQMNAFSLIELLVTMTIVAILAASSWPLYQHYAIKTRRTQAKTALMQLASQLERYAVTHHGYQGATLTRLGTQQTIANGYYHLTINTLGQHDFQIAAIPQRSQKQDTACKTLLLNSDGRRTMTGTASKEHCW